MSIFLESPCPAPLKTAHRHPNFQPHSARVGLSILIKRRWWLTWCTGGRYFLSRPRRFGKSLLVDTLRCVFQGRKELFTGLYIEDKWDWSTTYPVIKIDFADGNLHSLDALNDCIDGILRQNAEAPQYPGSKAAGYTRTVWRPDSPGRETVWPIGCYPIDEYDKPILDNIDRPEVSAQMRDGLKTLFSAQGAGCAYTLCLHDRCDEFSKVSLFSGLNQLRDLTLSPSFATICGYTQSDLDGPCSGSTSKMWTGSSSRTGTTVIISWESVYNPMTFCCLSARATSTAIIGLKPAARLSW